MQKSHQRRGFFFNYLLILLIKNSLFKKNKTAPTSNKVGQDIKQDVQIISLGLICFRIALHSCWPNNLMPPARLLILELIAVSQNLFSCQPVQYKSTGAALPVEVNSCPEPLFASSLLWVMHTFLFYPTVKDKLWGNKSVLPYRQPLNLKWCLSNDHQMMSTQLFSSGHQALQ